MQINRAVLSVCVYCIYIWLNPVIEDFFCSLPGSFYLHQQNVMLASKKAKPHWQQMCDLMSVLNLIIFKMITSITNVFKYKMCICIYLLSIRTLYVCVLQLLINSKWQFCASVDKRTQLCQRFCSLSVLTLYPAGREGRRGRGKDHEVGQPPVTGSSRHF